MITSDDFRKENIKKHNPNWPQVPDRPYRILIIEGSESGKTNSLFNVTSQQPDINSIYLHAQDPYEAKNQFLYNEQESTVLKHFNDSKAFTEYWNYMDKIYVNIEKYNPNKKHKILIDLDDMIADMVNNNKLNLIVT